MSKQSKIHSFFKAKTADELEVEELLFTQASRASRATTMETTKSINSIATSIKSIIDLSQNNDSYVNPIPYEECEIPERKYKLEVQKSKDKYNN